MPSRVSLRYGNRVFGLRTGSYVVGRSSQADLQLDDALVSRKHCRVTLDDAGALSIEDLASRNGVLVNGDKLEAPRMLLRGDRISVGPHVLIVMGGVDEERETATHGTMSGEPLEIARANGETRKGSIFEMFLASADRALADDDLSAAENLTGNLFVSLRAALLRGKQLEDGAFESTVVLGLKLAEETRTRRWLEKVLALYVAAGEVPAAKELERMRGLAAAGLPVSRMLGKYAQQMATTHGARPELVSKAATVAAVFGPD